MVRERESSSNRLLELDRQPPRPSSSRQGSRPRKVSTRSSHIILGVEYSVGRYMFGMTFWSDMSALSEKDTAGFRNDE